MRCVRRNVQRLWDLFVPFAEGTIGRAVLLAQQRGFRSKHKCAEMPKSRHLLPQARHCDCKRWVGGSGCQFIQIRFYVFLSIIYFDGLEFIIGIRKPEKVKWFPNSFCLIFQTLRRCNCVYQSRMPAAMQWLSKGWYYNHSNWHHDDSALSKRRHLGFATSAQRSQDDCEASKWSPRVSS